MANQTIPLEAGWFSDQSTQIQWSPPTNSRPQIDDALLASPPGFLQHVTIRSDGGVRVNYAPSQTASGNEEATNQFEENGSITITAGTNSFTINTEHDDTSEPYAFEPSNSADVVAFYNALHGNGDGSTAATYTIDDGATPDASAPTLTVTSPADVDERVTLPLTTSVSGGTYDSLSYAWDDDSAGGTFSAQAANTVYTPPNVSANTDVTITCTVTASGTGTNANDGTSATDDDTRDITVRPEVFGMQVFTLEGSTHTESSLSHTWAIPAGERPAIVDVLKASDSDTRLLAGLVVGNNNFVELLITSSQDEDPASTGDDLVGAFETDGSFEIVADSRTLTVEMSDSTDVSEPYRFQPSNTSQVSSFRTGVGSGDGVAGVLTLDSSIRPDAEAPAFAITGGITVDEDSTLSLSTTISGGNYDSLSYAWAVDSGGGTISGSGAGVTYNPPDVTQNTSVVVSCELTATGDGTNALSGDTDTATDTHAFTVTLVLPDATAPTTFEINAVDGVDEDDTLALSVNVSGGTYDTIDYVWQVLFSGGGTFAGSGASVTYNPPNVSSDTEITVAVTGTAGGTGTNAKNNTSDSTNDQEVFTVRAVTPLTLSAIAVPDGRMLVGTGSLITVPSDGDIFDSDATVDDGDDPPSLGHATLTASRIYLTGLTQLRLSNSGTGDIQTLYTSGELSDYQVHIQTALDASSVVSFGSDDIDQVRSRPARLLLGAVNDPDGVLDDVDALASGDNVLFFLTEPESLGTNVQADIQSGAPTVSARVRTTPPPQRVQSAITSGTATVTARVRTTPPPKQIQSSIESGTPSVSARIRTTLPGEAQISTDIESGVPSVSARVRLELPGAQVVADIQSGIATVSARVRLTLPPKQIQADIESGVPEVAVRVRTSVAGETQIQAAIQSGIADVSARVRITAPGEAQPVTFRQAAFANETDEVFLVLLTMSHDEFVQDFRFVNNMVDIYSRNMRFIAYAFEITLPDQVEDRPPRASIRVDNVDRRIIEGVRSVSSAIGIKIEVIMASAPDDPEITFSGFQLGSVEADAFTVNGELVLDDLTVEPYPAGAFTPAGFAGMF